MAGVAAAHQPATCMQPVYLNMIATAVPPHEVHGKFLDYAPSMLPDERTRRLFRRMAERAQIERRYSFVAPAAEPERLDRADFFRRGAFPDTAARMQLYERHAPELALAALERLALGAAERGRITHLLVTSCTGFYAPGLDLAIVQALGLRQDVERTLIGFMGCQAALPALRLASHIVRAQRGARVLIVNLELCTIHLQETSALDSLLTFVLFADGCAASLVSAEPTGIELGTFKTAILPDCADQITWHIGNAGFRMWLDGAVPATIARGLPELMRGLPGGPGLAAIPLWAVHPGGRSILDAVETGLELDAAALDVSRAVLRDYGNMSSATVMFVLARLLGTAPAGAEACALAFGPGLTAEAMTFRMAQRP